MSARDRGTEETEFVCVLCLARGEREEMDHVTHQVLHQRQPMAFNLAMIV